MVLNTYTRDNVTTFQTDNRQCRVYDNKDNIQVVNWLSGDDNRHPYIVLSKDPEFLKALGTHLIELGRANEV